MDSEEHAGVMDQVAPCGLRCGECDMGNGTVSGTAQNMVDFIQRYEVDQWAGQFPGGNEIDFDRLNKNLLVLVNIMKCPGCLNGGGNPECPIRLCSKDKGFTSCAQCSDLKGCTKFAFLGEKGEWLKNKLAEGSQ